ncbi:MAG: hypothetical protein H6668_13210 [Ardenticatenaceae bacterium]|nr:hypothetical protein [Ardenticatenaceae bacterium]
MAVPTPPLETDQKRFPLGNMLATSKKLPAIGLHGYDAPIPPASFLHIFDNASGGKIFMQRQVEKKNLPRPLHKQPVKAIMSLRTLNWLNINRRWHLPAHAPHTPFSAVPAAPACSIKFPADKRLVRTCASICSSAPKTTAHRPKAA